MIRSSPTLSVEIYGLDELAPEEVGIRVLFDGVEQLDEAVRPSYRDSADKSCGTCRFDRATHVLLLDA